MAERVRRHLLSQLLCLGRHTLTGVLGTSGRLFCDWSADYRMYSARRVDPRELFRPVRRALAERLAPGQPLVVALDDTRLRKSGNKTGRKPDYGEPAPTPEELRQDDSAPWQRIEAFASGKTHAFKIKTLGPLRWRPAGKDRDLLLVVVAPLGYRLTQGSRLLYRKPAYLICTDPAAALQEILQTYLWRWDVEVNFRDEKTLLGVGQAQVRHENSVEPVPALAVAAYAMLLAAAHEAYGPAAIPAALPPPKWRNKTPLRASTQSLLRHLRHEAWAQAIRFSGFKAAAPPDTKPQKLADCLESALFYATA